jgi:hypothetical protein
MAGERMLRMLRAHREGPFRVTFSALKKARNAVRVNVAGGRRRWADVVKARATGKVHVTDAVGGMPLAVVIFLHGS